MKLTQEFVDIAIDTLQAERIGKSNRFRYVSNGQAYSVTKRQLWAFGKAIKSGNNDAACQWRNAIEVPENAVK